MNASFPSPSWDAILQPPHQVMHFLKGTYLNIPTIFPNICSYIIVSEVFHDSLITLLIFQGLRLIQDLFWNSP